MTKYRVRNVGIAAGLAIAAAILISVYVASYRKHVDNGIDVVPVFVAAHDIGLGTNGSALGGAVKKAKVLQRSVVAGAISDPAQLAGLVASQPILAGEQITIRQFKPLKEQGVLARIQGNFRAVSVPGSRDQVLGGIANAGDRVDITGSWVFPEGSSHHVTRVIVRNALVLEAPRSGTGGLGSSAGMAITLRVTDAQYQKFFYVMKNGDWWLSLRPVSKPADSRDSFDDSQSTLVPGHRVVSSGFRNSFSGR